MDSIQMRLRLSWRIVTFASWLALLALSTLLPCLLPRQQRTPCCHVCSSGSSSFPMFAPKVNTPYRQIFSSSRYILLPCSLEVHFIAIFAHRGRTRSFHIWQIHLAAMFASKALDWCILPPCLLEVQITAIYIHQADTPRLICSLGRYLPPYLLIRYINLAVMVAPQIIH